VALLGGYYACSDGVLAGLASRVLPAAARAVGLACGDGSGRRPSLQRDLRELVRPPTTATTVSFLSREKVLDPRANA
jgi:hypothetical protein